MNNTEIVPIYVPPTHVRRFAFGALAFAIVLATLVLATAAVTWKYAHSSECSGSAPSSEPVDGSILVQAGPDYDPSVTYVYQRADTLQPIESPKAGHWLLIVNGSPNTDAGYEYRHIADGGGTFCVVRDGYDS